MTETILLAAGVGLLAVAVALLLALLRRTAGAAPQLGARLDELERSGERSERSLREELAKGREEAAISARHLREELAAAIRGAGDSLLKASGEAAAAQKNQLDSFAKQLVLLSESSEKRLLEVRATIDLQLDAMRATVDEKLQGTLEKRLGEAFQQVSERLVAVHEGLGEMRSLANGVGDLKKVLSNVRTRGTWGEIQLGELLGQILSPEQYECNVATRPGTAERVEFALRLPGRDEDGEGVVWLPIDAKFPQEDYQRLIDAEERADPAAADDARSSLESRIRTEARSIRDKYVSPPHTTDFAILFLPTEGLYAEVLRRPGLPDWLQRECRVTVAGPMTLGAFLNSLQMGFRTLAIQRRSSEVWKLLGAVKTQFGQFSGLLDKVQEKLQQASSTIEDASKKSRHIERRLRKVEELPGREAVDLLPEPEEGAPESDDPGH